MTYIQQRITETLRTVGLTDADPRRVEEYMREQNQVPETMNPMEFQVKVFFAASAVGVGDGA